MPTPVYPTSPAFSMPVTASLEFDTGIARGKNGVEQRWMRSAGKATWTLSYPHLLYSELGTLVTFFEARHGSADTFDFAFAGTTYNLCYFDHDSLSAVESSPKVYSATVKICMTLRTADSGTLASSFPALTNGAPTQRPYTFTSGFDTVSMRTEGGRYSYSNRTSAIRTWTAGGATITTADAQAIWTHFSRAQGQYRSFNWTDPDSATVYAVRFASDVVEWKFNDAGQSSLQVTLQQVL